MGRPIINKINHFALSALKLSVLVCFVWIGQSLLLGAGRAEALSPYDIPDTQPPSSGSYKSIFYKSIVEYNSAYAVYPPPAFPNYPRGCLDNTNKYHFIGWISQAGQPKNSYQINVLYGQSVDLQFQNLIFVCHQQVNEYGNPPPWFGSVPAGLPPQGSLTTDAVNFASIYISGSVVNVGSLSPSPNNKLAISSYNSAIRYWFSDPTTTTFTWNPPAGLAPGVHDIVIQLNTHAVMHWRYGPKACVTPPGGTAPQQSNPWTYGCPVQPSFFTIRINVAQPPPIISCGNVTTNPTEPEPETPFSGTVNFTLNGSPAGQSYPYTISISGSVIGSGTVQTGGSASATVNSSGLSAGKYPFDYVINVTGVGSETCPDTITVAPKPYLRVYGGDVLAGSGFGSGCSSATGSIIGWNSGDITGGGAGTQFAAQALRGIDGFVSAGSRSTLSPPNPPIGLSFANTAGAYGGNFGTTICALDYFGTKPSSATVQPSGYTVNSLNVLVGTHPVVYVDGDVSISGTGVSYQNSGSWTTLSQIPSYYLIARGNIYIQSSVSNLDGVYIAQPKADGTGGTIYTCASGFAAVAPASLYANCNSKLTINGAFLAKMVKFSRSNGLLKNAPKTNPGPPPTPGPAEPSSSPNIAEVFNYSPEMYLVNPGIIPLNTQYNSITSLPPVL